MIDRGKKKEERRERKELVGRDSLSTYPDQRGEKERKKRKRSRKRERGKRDSYN
jgi:hypothetical protein